MASSEKKSRPRGRPKGSGIDDALVLQAVSRLLRADPGLKPTTAIKRAGIVDASTIRRLRDKLKAFETPVSATAEFNRRASAPPVGATVPIASPQATTDTDRVAALDRTPDPRIVEAFLQAFMKSGPLAPRHSGGGAPSASLPEMGARQTSEPGRSGEQKTHQRPTDSDPVARPTTTQPFPMPGWMNPGMPNVGATAAPVKQMEGMKLALEAMTSIAKLQVHAVESVLSYSPLTAMLQGQAMMGQMLVAAFSGQMTALQKREKKS